MHKDRVWQGTRGDLYSISTLKDYTDWIEKNVCEMEKTNSTGNSRRMYDIFNLLSAKPKPPPHNLTTDEEGNLLKSAMS